MSETILSKVLEAVESLHLPEGDYLETCTLIKDCYKRKDRWISETKNFEKKYTINMYNTKGLCISIDLKKIVDWKLNNNDSPFVKKPDTVYTFDIVIYDTNNQNRICKTLERKEENTYSFLEPLASMYCVNKYEIYIDNLLVSSEEMYTWISKIVKHLTKVYEINHGDSDDEDFHFDEDNFYRHIVHDMKTLFHFACDF